jgi:uncharacterized membrane protein
VTTGISPSDGGSGVERKTMGKKGRAAIGLQRGIALGMLFGGLKIFLNSGASGPDAAAPWDLLGVALFLLDAALWFSSDGSNRGRNGGEDREASDTGDAHQENR